MKKIVLLMLFISSLAFADYTFEVENSTMVEAYYNIFNAISAIFQNGEYLDLLRLVFLLGGFFVFATAILKSFEGNQSSNPISHYGKYLFIGMATLTLAFSTKETVWVTSKTLPSFCSNSSPNVGFAVQLPSLLAFSFTTVNKVGKGLTEMSETAFTAPSSNGTSSMADSDGYLGSLKQTIKILSLDPEKISGKSTSSGAKAVSFNSRIGHHYSVCVFNVSQNKINGEDKLAEMNDSKNLYKWTKDFLDFSYGGQKTGESLITTGGTTMSCREHFALLEKSVKALQDKYACMLPLAHGGVLELIMGTTSGTQSKMTEIITQSGLISALESSRHINAVGISGASYASGKTRAEFTQSQMAAGAYMAEMLPYIQMTMRAILYGFFPFVFVIVLLPGGLKVLVQYGQTMLWIELWGPTAAVINMFVNLKAKHELSNLYDESGLSMMTSIDMLTEASTIAGYGAYLYMSVPALTWLILKGSGHMLGNITGAISARYSGNLTSESIAKDTSMAKASSATGKSITSMINSIEASGAANKASDAIAFDKVGMKKTIDTKSTTNLAQRQAEIEKIASQNGKDEFLETQKTKAGYDATAEKADVQAKTDAGGKNIVEKDSYIGTSTKLETTKKEIKSVRGDANKVIKTKSDMANKSFNKDLEVNKSTTVDDFKNLGKKEGAETSGTSKVVEGKGAESFKDAKIQELLTNVDTAKSKKDIAGSNKEASKIDVKKAESEFKTAKKTFDKYSTDTTSTSDFEKRKEDITKTLETKKSIESTGQSTENFYSNEAKQSAEDRKAQITKIDLNNDNKLDDGEVSEYGKDMTIKSISDQNALKAKNERLVENGKKMLSSDNKDVKDTMTESSKTYASHGNEVALAAGALATQTSISTKEQRFTSDEKSEYVDQMESAGLSGVDKADTQVLKDAEDIEKTHSETESYLDVSKEQNKDEVYDDVTENFERKGMSKLEAQNSTLFAFAKSGKMKESFSEKVFSNNLKSVINERDKAFENEAYKQGFISSPKGDFSKESAPRLEKRKEELDATIKAFDKFRNDRGQLSPKYQMNVQPLLIERDNINYKLDNIKGLNEFKKTDAGRKIATESVKKIDNLVHNMKAMKLAEVDDNGNIKFGTSFEKKDATNLTMSDKVSLRREKGGLDGNKISAVGANGRSYEIVTDLANRRITNFSSAKNGYSNTAASNNDILYNVQQTEKGKENMKMIGNLVTGGNFIKDTVSAVGVGKFLKGGLK